MKNQVDTNFEAFKKSTYHIFYTHVFKNINAKKSNLLILVFFSTQLENCNLEDYFFGILLHAITPLGVCENVEIRKEYLSLLTN